MNRDWVQDSKLVAEKLQLAGFADAQKKLIESIEAGSTGGEILMALRWNFQEILKNSSTIKNELKKTIIEIIEGITLTLEV